MLPEQDGVHNFLLTKAPKFPPAHRHRFPFITLRKVSETVFGNPKK